MAVVSNTPPRRVDLHQIYYVVYAYIKYTTHVFALNLSISFKLANSYRLE